MPTLDPNSDYLDALSDGEDPTTAADSAYCGIHHAEPEETDSNQQPE